MNVVVDGILSSVLRQLVQEVVHHQHPELDIQEELEMLVQRQGFWATYLTTGPELVVRITSNGSASVWIEVEGYKPTSVHIDELEVELAPFMNLRTA